MVEVAHNDNLTNFKKFVIIIIQVKEPSDMVPRIKGSHSKTSLLKNSLMLGHFPSTEKSRVGFPLLCKKVIEPCYIGI